MSKIWNEGVTKENNEWAKKSSERMKINNPSKNPEIVKKRVESFKKSYSEGKWIHPLLGKKHSEETREKISKSLLGKPNPKGSETRKRLIKEGKVKAYGFGTERPLINPMLGKKHKDHAKNLMSIAASERKGELNHFFGKKHSGEFKIKHSLFMKEYCKNNENAMQGKHHTEKTKEIIRQKRSTWVTPKIDTTIEVKIQNFLKELGIEFYTHSWRNMIEHKYQCDILVPSKNLVIECFGDYWHNIPYGNDLDALRCQELRDKGFKVLVFWEREIKVMQKEDLQNELVRLEGG